MDYGGSTDGITSNNTALANAIASLGTENGSIYFPAGIFFFNVPVVLRSGLILKGAGSGSTTLMFDLNNPESLVKVTGNPTDLVGNIIVPAFKNEMSVQVDNAGEFNPGDYIKVFQNDAAIVNDNWALESVAQVLRITSIDGNTINFNNALRRNYVLADQPRIRKLQMNTGTGIECLKIKRIDISNPVQTSNILFSYAANCWVKAVESDSCNFAHIQVAWSRHIEVSNCYFHGAFGYGSGGQGYGISCEFATGDCLFENNIFKHLRHSMLLQSGANGNVFAYNYSREPYKTDGIPTDYAGDIVLHGNYPYLNLFEGNIVQNIFIDASHGKNGPYNTIFRNRAESYGIIISPGAGDSSNIAGNEITGTGLGKGNYSMNGAGNFEYGNNKNNTILPAGTTSLTDRSCFYNSIPSCWNIPSPWPSIGMFNIFNTGNIPARKRYTSATDLCYCLSPIPVVYIFTGIGNWDIASNWLNNIVPPAVLSEGSQIIIDPPGGQQCILNIAVTINPGVIIKVMPGKKLLLQGNLNLVQ